MFPLVKRLKLEPTIESCLEENKVYDKQEGSNDCSGGGTTTSSASDSTPLDHQVTSELKEISSISDSLLNACTSDAAGVVKSDSDDETEQSHPNRRLQSEKSVQKTAVKSDEQQDLTMLKSVVQKPPKVENPPKEEKPLKPSEMWVGVLANRKLQNEERPWEANPRYQIIDEQKDYMKLLTDILCEREDEGSGYRLYERRFYEKLDDPDFKYFLSELYIPPAQVEVFHQQLTDTMSAQECLRLVCRARKWPQPSYFPIINPRNREGFFTSCRLKGKSFKPWKPASNRILAQEMAAAMALDWLGLRQRRSERFSDFTRFTYFR